MGGGKEDKPGKLPKPLPGDGVHLGDALHLVAKELHPDGLGIVGGEDLQHLPLRPEAPRGKVYVVPLVTEFQEALQKDLTGVCLLYTSPSPRD